MSAPSLSSGPQAEPLQLELRRLAAELARRTPESARAVIEPIHRAFLAALEQPAEPEGPTTPEERLRELADTAIARLRDLEDAVLALIPDSG